MKNKCNIINTIYYMSVSMLHMIQDQNQLILELFIG